MVLAGNRLSARPHPVLWVAQEPHDAMHTFQWNGALDLDRLGRMDDGL
jgi:hypothetical protein